MTLKIGGGVILIKQPGFHDKRNFRWFYLRTHLPFIVNDCNVTHP